jgi:hypothetical protein
MINRYTVLADLKLFKSLPVSNNYLYVGIPGEKNGAVFGYTVTKTWEL